MKNSKEIIELRFILNKSKDYAIRYSHDDKEIQNLFFHRLKFLNFEIKSLDSNPNSRLMYEGGNNDKSVNNFLILLCSSNVKTNYNNDQDDVKSVLAEISLDHKKDTSSANILDNTILKLTNKNYIKLNKCTSDKDNLAKDEEAELEYELKIIMESQENENDANKNNDFNNITNIPAHKLKNNFDSEDIYNFLLVDDDDIDDEEDEDYEESEVSQENSNLDDSDIHGSPDYKNEQICETKLIAKDDSDDDDDNYEFDSVEELFEETEDINRDLLYLSDQELNYQKKNMLNFINKAENVNTDNKAYTNNNNNNNFNNNINIKKNRYMLRRKRKPANYSFKDNNI